MDDFSDLGAVPVKPTAKSDDFNDLGAVPASEEEIKESKFGGSGQQALTALESSIPGAKAFESAEPDKLVPILNRMGTIGRIAGVAKTIMGKVNPEDIRAREETNPIASTAGNVASLLIPGGEGALLEKVGTKALLGAQKAIPQLAGKGILKGMSRSAIKLAAENALYQAGDESTKMILDDPNQTVGSAISNIGLAAGIGAVAGGAIGAINPLWKAASETKMGQLVSDFKARMQEHLGMPVEAEIAPNKGIPREGMDPFTKEPIEVKGIEPAIPKANIDPFTKQPLESVKPITEIPKELSTTPGSKLADTLVKNSDNITAKGLAAAVGAGIGHMTGIPYAGTIGALLGERALAPVIKSILPAIGKTVLSSEVNPQGFKAALDYAVNAIKGQKLASAAIKNVFQPSSEVLPENKRPNAETRKKLDTALQSFQQDPSKLANIGSNIGHYMPNHAVSIGTVTTNAVNFLNSIKPQDAKRAPLDPPLKPSQAVQAQYDRVLDIAQQPLTVLSSIKDGTLTSHDVIALHTLYPDLYASLRTKLMAQVIDVSSKGDTIPYSTRLGLSMFLQQPLDSTMKPMAIASAQPTPEPEPPQMPQSPKKVSQAASSNLIKGAKSAQTASQASENMHSSGKA